MYVWFTHAFELTVTFCAQIKQTLHHVMTLSLSHRVLRQIFAPDIWANLQPQHPDNWAPHFPANA